MVNVHKNFSSVHTSCFYSCGIHPWFIEDDIERQIEELKSVVFSECVLAIGECGLDKPCKTNFTLQQNLFSRQIVMANEIQKPIIIHCVKAFDEVLLQLQQEKVSVPVIFHGFNKSKELAKRIIDNGYYLSFGKHLLHPPIQETFSEIPLDKTFFETDVSEIPIETIYEKAAMIKMIPMEEIKVIVNDNFKKIFKGSAY